jgi:hypothetical protein
MYADVSQLQQDWADASLKCWQQGGSIKGENTIMTGGEDACAMRAMMPT